MNPIAHQRLYAQQLLRSSDQPARQPADVVACFAAMQAQEFALAKWAIGLRAPTVTEADVSAAFDEGTILRTHLLRPTWHFVTPADIDWLLLLTAPRVKQLNASADRQHGLTEAIFSQTNTLIEQALADHTYLTRTELAERLALAGYPASGQRLAHIMMRAELDGIICSGPRRGEQFTYALLDERAPQRTTLTRDEALAQLTQHYVRSRGPVSVHDFSVWSGLTIRDVQAGLAMQSGIHRQTIDGQTYYAFADADHPPFSTDGSATCLLPDYDEYGMGYKNRTALMDPLATGSFAFNRVILVDGLMAGSWKRQVQKRTVLIDLHLNRALSDRQHEHLYAAAERYARFIDKQAAIRLSC